MPDEIFKKYDYPIRSSLIRKHLLKIRGIQCECCKNTQWLGQPINLEVHHIDGDKSNNNLDNLQLLCPNCHSYTENYGSKNLKKTTIITDKEFIEELQKNSSIRQTLFNLGLSDAGANYNRARQLIRDYHISLLPTNHKTKEKFCKNCHKPIDPNATYCKECYKLLSRQNRPSREELKKLIRNNSFVEIGKMFNISDNAIRKWCKTENLPFRKKDINSYSDEEWNLI